MILLLALSVPAALVTGILFGLRIGFSNGVEHEQNTRAARLEFERLFKSHLEAHRGLANGEAAGASNPFDVGEIIAGADAGS